MAVTGPQLTRTMRKVFGLEQFRPGQEEVIRSVIAGRDTLAIMPTDSGKSLASCRWKALLDYFEAAADPEFACGACDVCAISQSHVA